MSPARLLLIPCALAATIMLTSCGSSDSNAPTQATSTQHSIPPGAIAAAGDKQGKQAPAENDFSTQESLSTLAQSQKLMPGHYTPYQGSSARIYGSTGLGCIDGAVAVKESKSLKFQVWGRGRNFAHPLMAQYLDDLRQKLKDQGLPPLVVGDISRKYGGPYGPSSNHSSHNTGLDVDLPFFFAQGIEPSDHPDVYIVRGEELLPTFTADIASLIINAASDPRVDRVFVAPKIKQRMCQIYEREPYNGFLHKLRPWFGHQAHMHVRLKCPSDSPNCISQAPIPAGTGCGYEVESWFLPPPPKSATANKPKPKKEPPYQCKVLWWEHDEYAPVAY